MCPRCARPQVDGKASAEITGDWRTFQVGRRTLVMVSYRRAGFEGLSMGVSLYPGATVRTRTVCAFPLRSCDHVQAIRLFALSFLILKICW